MVLKMAEEKQFENKIKKFLKDNGAWGIKYWSGKSYTGQKFTKDGVPDLIYCFRGRFIAIEVKASNGKPSDLQLYNLHEIDKSGGYAILLYPEDFELFKKMIFAMNRNNLVTVGESYMKLYERWANLYDAIRN